LAIRLEHVGRRRDDNEFECVVRKVFTALAVKIFELFQANSKIEILEI